MTVNNPDTFEELIDLPNFVTPENMKGTDNTIEKILVIGIGGAGNNAVNYLYHQKDYIEDAGKTVTHYVLNTDELALNNMTCENRMVLGKNLLKGKGAGANINIGQKATEENRDQIEEICRGVDLVFITAGMGGGTGTLGSSVVAEIAKNQGAIVVSLVTLPYTYENRVIPAISGVKSLMNLSDSLITIDNQKIVDYYPDLDFISGLNEANKILANAISGIIRVIRRPALMNTDFEDLKTILNYGGRTKILHKTVSGDKLKNLNEDPERVIEDIYKEVTDSPLISLSNIKEATAILMYIECTHHFTQRLINLFVSKFSDPNGQSSTLPGFDDLLEQIDDFDLSAYETNRPTVIFAYDKLEHADDNGNTTPYDEPQINVTIVATGMDANKARKEKADHIRKNLEVPENDQRNNVDAEPVKPAAPAAQAQTPAAKPVGMQVPQVPQVPPVAPAQPKAEAQQAQAAANPLAGLNLNNLTPEVLAQLAALLQQQQAAAKPAEAPAAQPASANHEKVEEKKPAQNQAQAQKQEPHVILEPSDLPIDE